MDNFTFFISTVVPILSKNALTFLLGGQIVTGPFFKDIGGKGMALTIFALTFIIFFNSERVIVEIKLIIVWFDLNFKFLIIFSPTVGVIAKKIQLQEFTISWLSFAIFIFLNLFFKNLDIFLFLGDIIISL